MPIRLDIQKILTSRSERVKSIELHPKEPWLLCSLYTGIVHIWNYETQQILSSFDVCAVPVRCARFISRKNWLITGSDDSQLRVYNYNTKEKLKTIDSHIDYIRSISVHPTHSFVLTCSDDTTIRLFDWEDDWNLKQIFEGHSHFVMDVLFNPRDSNTFASGALDNTIKIWQLGSTTPNYTLEGHLAGVNTVCFFLGSEQPYLISGADDFNVKIWDYQTKRCLQTLTGHSDNVTAVGYHPNLPIIISGSEDGTLQLWHSVTYRLENTLNYGLGRVWSIGFMNGSNLVAIGFENGSIVIKLGNEKPAASMDSTGKIIFAKNNDIQQANIKMAVDTEIVDGEPLLLTYKDLGNSDIFPQSLQHSPNGRFVVVCGDGEYIIYTALAWRNKSYGSALQFVWAQDSGDYAIRENSSKVKIFKNFKEKFRIPLDFIAENISGGKLLGVCSSESLAFFDWETSSLISKFEINSKFIVWSSSGEFVCVGTIDSFYILQYNKEIVSSFFDQNLPIDENGIEDSFKVLTEVKDSIRNGIWVGECFVFINLNNNLCYYIGKDLTYEIIVLQYLEKEMYLLGYLEKENRLFLITKDHLIVCYELDSIVLQYQMQVLKGNLESANSLLPDLHTKYRTRIAQFLEKQGYLEEALKISIDADHRFELSLALKNFELSYEIALTNKSNDLWKELGKVALQNGKYDIAEQCMKKTNDHSSLFLLYYSTRNKEKLKELAHSTKKIKRNISFNCFFLLHSLDDCLDLLFDSGRYSEAALFSRTFLPSRLDESVLLWKQHLIDNGDDKIANLLADPKNYPNLFSDFDLSLKAEKYLKKKSLVKSNEDIKQLDFRRNIIEMLRNNEIEEDQTSTTELENIKTTIELEEKEFD